MAINLGAKEKRIVVWGIVVLVFAVIAPNFLGEEAYAYRNKQVEIKNNLDKRIKELRDNLSGIEGKKEILRRYITRYKSLVEREAILPPDTVSLVKHMKSISIQRKQEATAFEFGDNMRMKPENSKYTDGSSVGIDVYPLNLKMDMLHDMDMFMFLESLGKRVSNVSFPVKCSMNLTNKEFVVTKRDNMTAECQVNWYSVSDPERNIKTTGEGAEETASAGN